MRHLIFQDQRIFKNHRTFNDYRYSMFKITYRAAKPGRSQPLTQNTALAARAVAFDGRLRFDYYLSERLALPRAPKSGGWKKENQNRRNSCWSCLISKSR